MTIRTAQLQDAATQSFEKLKAYLNPVAKDAYALGYKKSKQLRKAYPALVENVGDVAYKTLQQSKQGLKTAGHQVAHTAAQTAHSVGRGVHTVESKLLKVGFIYMIYRLVVSDEQVVKVANKVKAHIHQKPIKSAAIALGAGYVIGKIVRW